MNSHKLKQFWSHRPPFVVFLICLASFALTLFSLSVFVAQTDKIRNPDVLDWNKLLVKLTKLEFCVPSSKAVGSKYNISTFDWASKADWANQTLSVRVSKQFSQAFYNLPQVQEKPQQVKAKGRVEVKHLGRGIRPEFHDEVLFVNFDIPKPKDKDESSESCLEIQGPQSLLRHLILNDTTSDCNHQQGEFVNVPLLTHSPDHKPLHWCQEDPSDVPLNLEFDMDYDPDLTMYVSAQEKELIHLHLMVTSVFLFAILAIVIIAFLIRSLSANRKSIDARGDHHIMMTQLEEN